jgi:uncharacterized membrane protein
MSALTYLVLTVCVSTAVCLLAFPPIFWGVITGAMAGDGGTIFLGMMTGYMIGIFVGVLVSMPLSIGGMFVWLDVARGGPVVIETLFEPFRRFLRYLGACVVTYIYVLLWSLLFYIPGIVKAIAWSQMFFIMRENPGMKGREARRLSAQMMKGHKWEYFLLGLSFIGWILLGVLSLGIAYFWVYPYVYTAYGAFYEEVKRGAV